MNVNSVQHQIQQQANHLIEWVNSERQHFGSDLQFIYSLESAWHSGLMHNIFMHLSPGFCQISEIQSNEPWSLLPYLQTYLQKQMGKRIRTETKNKIKTNPPTSQSLQTGLQLLIYICFHSDQQYRTQFIGRVLKLPKISQTSLMSSLNNIEQNLDNIIEIRQLLSRINQLQNQNDLLKQQVYNYQNKFEVFQDCIQELQIQNKQIKLQISKFRGEKQKIFQVLRIVSLEDYLIVCNKLQDENIIMSDYINQMERKNNTLDQSYRDLQKSFGDRSMVIAELSDQITRVKQKYNTLKMDKQNQENFESDMSRSFGNTLKPINQNVAYYSGGKHHNENQSLLDISYIKNKRDPKFSNFTQWCIQLDSSMPNKQNALISPQHPSNINRMISEEPEQSYEAKTEIDINVCCQELSAQNISLRKHTADMMQKLEDTYKTVQSLTIQGSRCRQRNQKLQKNNKLYQKQLKLLKQLNVQFERKFIAGQV